MGRLDGKIAFVTGAGTGIGRACMVMFAKEGATVFGVSRTQANLDESLRQVHSTPIDKWREVMALNLDCVFYVSRLVIRQMKQQGKGSIVNVASIFGLGGAPDAHTYTATKGAIINLTRSMSVAYVDDHIRCNVVAPGFVQTQMVESVIPMLFSSENPKLISPMGRPATPEEVAYACLFLASDEASYCTGTVLTVDGGSTARA